MKKFISALSSLAIAATAMGGTMTYAATNDSVGADVKTIIEFQSEGKNTVSIPSGSAATQIPVSIFIPQANKIQSIQLKLQINDGEPGKGVVLDQNGDKVEGHEASMGNYGFSIDGDGLAAQWKATKICLDSGSVTNNKKHAGYYNTGSMSNFVADSFNIGYIAVKAVNAKKNIDSYCAWKAAGEPDYASYTPITSWTKDEAWAYDAPFVTFNLNVPAGLKDGNYVLDVRTEACYNTAPSSLFTDDNTPKDKANWDTVQSKITGTDDGTDSVERKFETVPLTIKVGEAPVDETTKPADETTKPADETTKPVEETTKPADQTQPQQEETKPAETIAIDDETIIYNLVPQGKDCTILDDAVVGNNVYNVAEADCGKEVAIDWKVKNDPGTAGLQMSFNFSQIEYVSGAEGDAYMASPEYNDHDANGTTGEIIYTFGSGTAEDPVSDGVVYTFTVKIPEAGAAAKTYSIGINKTGGSINNKVIPVDQDNPFKFNFHGLDIVVPAAGGAQETTKPVDETTKPADETTKPADETTAPEQTVKPGEKLIGDVNCDGSVKINDVVLLNRKLAGTKELTEQGAINADANVDNQVNADDSLEIKEYLALLNRDTTKVGTTG